MTEINAPFTAVQIALRSAHVAAEPHLDPRRPAAAARIGGAYLRRRSRFSGSAASQPRPMPMTPRISCTARSAPSRTAGSPIGCGRRCRASILRSSKAAMTIRLSGSCTKRMRTASSATCRSASRAARCRALTSSGSIAERAMSGHGARRRTAPAARRAGNAVEQSQPPPLHPLRPQPRDRRAAFTGQSDPGDGEPGSAASIGSTSSPGATPCCRACARDWSSTSRASSRSWTSSRPGGLAASTRSIRISSCSSSPPGAVSLTQSWWGPPTFPPSSISARARV